MKTAKPTTTTETPKLDDEQARIYLELAKAQLEYQLLQNKKLADEITIARHVNSNAFEAKHGEAAT